MVKQIKLFIQLNSYKWWYAFLFIATIGFDIFLFTIRNKDVSAFSPYNMALYIMLMYAFPIQKASLRNRRLKESYYLLPKNKKDLILDEWKIVLLLNVFSFILWSVEIILSKETLTIMPLLYVYSAAIIMNAVTFYSYYANWKYKNKNTFMIYCVTFIAINFIFLELQFKYLENHAFAHEFIFSVLPFVALAVSILISIILIKMTIKNSFSKSLVWSD
ncbi:hypothetical protein ACMGE5_09625 [Macrococcus equi]|uniref:hypothetical protein n=1 Tax=Macrococcus equi TaxID=3395462 RepID=UPI0039BDC549